jgi:hypothetical protein
LNLTNNLIIYQTIFDPIFTNKKKRPLKQLNKTKFQTSTNEYNIPRTFSQHGLLIDKYLNKISVDEDSTNDSFLRNDFIRFVFLFVFLFLIFYFRNSLLKPFRERQKRSVLKYSV